MKRIVTLLTLVILSVNGHAARMGPWDLDELFKVPKWEKTDTAAKPGITGILYSSIPYKGSRR